MDQSQAKQTDQKLTHERWELILRSMDAAPWDWNLVNGEVYFSPTWWNLLGYVNAELPATSALMASFFHPDDAQHIDQTFTEAVQGGGETWETECSMRHKQGHYVRCCCGPIFSAMARAKRCGSPAPILISPRANK